MLNLNLKWVICLLIGLVLLIGFFSFAHELPSVSIETSYGSTFTISTFAAAQREWTTHEVRLLTANQEMQKLKYERDIIDAAISKNRTELKKFKTVTILVSGRKIGFAAVVNAMVDLLDNGNTYEMGLQRISKYGEIRSQNTKISNAASDRDLFYSEYSRRWQHQYSPSNRVPPKINTPTQESIPMLGASCKNACGIFWYDSVHVEYYSGFSGGIPAVLSMIPGLARSSHQSTCKGTASCGKPYWTCEGSESGGTALHQPRTCKIQGLKWNPDTTGYDPVTCNMPYRNCDNPGGRCFNGSSAGNQKHNDDPPVHSASYHDCGVHLASVSGSHSWVSSCTSSNSNGTCTNSSGYYACSPHSHSYPTPSPSYHACGVHLSTASGDHSLQASCPSTDSNGNSCTVSSFYACDGHTHSYPSPPPPTTVSCGRSACTETVSSALEHRVGPCSACGGTYWSCGPNANWGQHYHRHRTCRFLTCRQTWRLCVDEKPDCLARSRQGQKCWSE